MGFFIPPKDRGFISFCTLAEVVSMLCSCFPKGAEIDQISFRQRTGPSDDIVPSCQVGASGSHFKIIGKMHQGQLGAVFDLASTIIFRKMCLDPVL